MTYSHPSTGLSIECSVLPPEIVEAFGSAMTFVCEQIERQDQGPQAFARLEEGLMDQVFAIARSALRGCIEARDDGNKPIRRDGEAYYRAAPANKVINTLFGPVTYARSRYRTASGRSSFAPVDESLGLFDDYLTASVAYRCLLVLDHCATRDAAALLRKLGGMNPSASQLHRLGEVAGRLWKEKGEAAMDAIRKAERIPAAAVSFAVSLDGVMVPILPHEDGREDASWREASCGTISFHDADGTRLDTLYLAQMPEAGKVTLKRQLNDEVAHIRKVRPDLRLVALADAAADNWTFLDGLKPDACAVDYFHACEHVAVVANVTGAADFYTRYRTILRDDPDGVDKLIRAIRHLRDKATTANKDLDRERAFFRKNRHRMRYATLQADGYAIGSGVVEAANKVLVAQRMKRAGMRWSIAGGQNILTFRALIRSERFERAWQIMVGNHAANDNIEITELAA